MTFIERYKKEETWYGKAIIMGIYHTVMCQKNKDWALIDTANDFQVSIGLVSENIRLALALDKDKNLINCKTRQIALEKIK